MKKLLLMAVIISATAFGVEATTATTGKMMHQGQGNGTAQGHMMNQGNGTGKMSCDMMQGGKMGGMKGQMMNSLSEKDQSTVTKNRTEIHTLMAEKEPNWKKIQKLHDENALIMSKGKVEMMKKNHPNMMNGTMNHTNMNHQNTAPVAPVKQN